MDFKKVAKAVGTFGGPISIRKDRLWMYSAHQGKKVDVAKFYGVKKGPLHFGMPSNREEMALDAVESDTKADLIRELVSQGGLSRSTAESVVRGLIKKGILKEVQDEDLGKVLVARREVGV